MVRISGLFGVALSLPLVLLGACTSIPPSSSANSLNDSLNDSPNSSSRVSPNPVAYQPPRREIPLRTESAGVRLNEEYCINSSPSTVTVQTRLTQSLSQLVLSMRMLLPMPVVPPKINQIDRNLRCNS